MAYVPNATDATQPVESQTVESAALEFRTLKDRVNDLELDLDTVDAGLIAADAAESAARAAADSALDVRVDAIENALLSIGEGGLPGTVYVQRFSGTGVQTAFTLNATPQTGNVVDIYINGIYQNKDTFSVTGAVITFSEAPPAGTDNIEVQVTVTIALGDTDASLVSFDGGTVADFFKTKNNRVVDSISALRGLDKTKYTRAFVTGYYASGDGGGGAYWYDSTDVASTDNGGTIIVAADGGRWKLQVIGFLSVKQFGAKGDGTTNDTAAIQATLNAIGSGLVFAPHGLYQVTSLTIPAGVTLLGEGAYATVIRTTSATLTMLTLNASARMKDIKLMSSVTRTNGFYVDIQGNGAILDNCEFDGYSIGVNVGTLGNAVIVGTLITDCEFRNPAVATGSGAIQFINFSNAEVRNNIISGSAGTQADFGIRFQNGDTALLASNNITVHGRALLIDTPAGYNLYATTISDCLFDSAGTVTGAISVQSAYIVPAGSVYNTRISNSWFGLSATQSGCYVGTSGAGVVDGITFTGCEFTKNGDCGLIVVGAGVKNWEVTGGHSGGNTNSGIRAATGTSYFTVTGHRAGNIAGRGPNNNGITIDAAASDYYVIDGCNVAGNTSAGISDSGTGTNATVVNNLGYNGVASVSGVSVGASPWSYTAGHTPETMYFAGGTLSAINIDGQTVQNTTAATIQLLPNETMQVTYTAAPTVMRKRN